MKTIFVFDTVLLKDKKNDFYAQTLTFDFFKNRYFGFCDEMIITTRAKDIDDFTEQNKGYRKTNGNKVKVCPINSYKDIPDMIKNRKKIMNEMDCIVKECDNLIIRMPSVLGLFACKSATKFNKNYIVEMVACAWDGYMNHARFGGKILAPIMYLKNRAAIKKAPNVLYVTNNFLQKRYPNKKRNMGCTDTVLVEKTESFEKEKLEQLSKSNMKSLNIVTVASVQLKYKGQEYVMKAIRDLKRKGFNYKYFLLGGGNNKRLMNYVLKYNLENDVFFLGSKPHYEVFDCMKKMDLYIQPSLQEGLPRAVVEAMSVGMPIIGSNAGGIPEIIEPQYIFKKKNVRQLEKILENLTNDSLLEQSRRNFDCAKQYMPRIIDKRRADFYKEVLKGGEINEG